MRKKILALVFGFVLVMSTSASAAIVLDNWTLDLTNVDGGVQYLDSELGSPTFGTLQPLVVSGVSEITYVGMAHGQQVTFNNGVPDYTDPNYTPVGEYNVIDGLLSATSLVSGGSVIPNTSLGSTWELTFDFSTNVVNTDYTFGGATSFTHLAYDTPAPAGVVPDATVWADGFLDVYVDSFLNTTETADLTTGLGYRDTGGQAEWIARFAIDAGEGGIFTPSTYDGSDDASFSLVSAKTGVFLHPIYGDLSQYTLGELEILFAITDSNLDGDPLSNPSDNFGIGIDYYTDLSDTVANPGSTWPFFFNGAGSPVSQFLKEDGSVSIGVTAIPEPSTFLLLGAGLLGLGFIGRKKMKK